MSCSNHLASTITTMMKGHDHFRSCAHAREPFSITGGNTVQRLTILLVICLALTAPIQALDFKPVGVGGGGYLHAGAYHPTNPNWVMIGADVSGTYLSTDGGQTWAPHNAGLLNSDELATHYVEDIEGVSNNDFSGFIATTYGGIYQCSGTGDWTSMTPIQSYYYMHDMGWGDQPMGIPFSCVDVSENIAVAGAGRTRFGTSNETTYYPAPDNVSSSSHGIHSIWICDLSSATPTWTPMPNTNFGAVRDITILRLGTTNFIAAVTATGVYYFNGSTWTDIGGLYGVIDAQTVGLMPYGTVMNGWSIHLTKWGHLFMACTRDDSSDPTNPFPSGVYRMGNIVIQGPSLWHYMDNGQPVNYFNVSLTTIGRDGSMHPDSSNQNIPNAKLAYLTVVDSPTAGGDDVLYLGCTGGTYGLFKGVVPYDAQYGDGAWTSLVSTNGWNVPGALRNADDGWIDFWGAKVLFHPTVAPSNTDNVIVQFDSRLHRSADAGATWSLAYTTGSAAGWSQVGYNEICVLDLDFWGDQLVEATGDCGLFMATSTSMASFVDMTPAVAAQNSSTPTDRVWANECHSIEVVDDWNGSGDRAMFVGFGDVIQKNRASRIMMYHDFNGTGPTWEFIGGTLTDPEYYLFYDMTMKSDTELYVNYRKYDAPVGSHTNQVESGVMAYTYNGSTWSTSFLNTGLPANKVLSDLLYHSQSNRLFLTANHSHGGIWYCDFDVTPLTWVKCVGPDDAGVPASQDIWGDVNCLAQSDDGSTIYAGTRGRSADGYGTVLKCTQAGIAMPLWTPQVNQTVNDLEFGFTVPTHQGWTLHQANKNLTSVQDILVTAGNADTYYLSLGSNYGYLQNAKSLWYYNGSKYSKVDSNEDFEGITVSALEMTSDNYLVVGTSGLETWVQKKITDPGYDPHNPVGGLRLHQRQVRGEGCLISYSTSRASSATIGIYDLRGRLVRRIEANHVNAGQQSVMWDGRSGEGLRCASGVYLVKVQAGNQTGQGKVTMIR